MAVDASAKPKIRRREEIGVAIIVRDYQNASASKVENSPVILEGDDMNCIAYSVKAPVYSSASTVCRRGVNTV